MAASPMRSGLLVCVVCVVGAVGSRESTTVAAQHQVSPLSACEPPFGQAWAYDNLMCLRQAGATHGLRAEVSRRLRTMGAGSEDHPWPTLVLAHAALDQVRRDAAIALYEVAAAGFAKSGEAEGEIIARQNLANQYRHAGHVERAAGQVARAVAAAETSRAPLNVARAAVLEAVHAMATGGDIGRVHRVLVRADSLVSAAAPVGLRRTILFNLAMASLYLGHTDAAIDALERHRRLRVEDGSSQNAITVEFNLLTAHLMMSEQRPRPGARTRLVADAEKVLNAARSTKDPLIEARAHQVLGDLSAASDPVRAAAHLQRCLDLESALRFPRLRARCLWSLAGVESARDPSKADRLGDRALSMLNADHDRLMLAHAWQARLRLVWRILPEVDAIHQSHQALDSIERLRSSQTSERGRAELFGNWVRDYQWLTGKLFGARRPRLAEAFEVGERLRARVLLERVEHAGEDRGSDDERERARVHVEQRIADAQRRLLSASLAVVERRALLGQLRLLELEREDVLDGRVRALPVRTVPFTSITAVQRTLDDDEAMVWFSIAPWQDVYGDFGGGSWAVTITPRQATIHPLSVGDSLDAQIAALTGQLRVRETRSDVWKAAARRLSQALFDDALGVIRATTTKLVVVTDGALHRMPFEVLPLPSGQMLGDRFEISQAPSATLWTRMRESRHAPPGHSVLVIADPELPENSTDGRTPLRRLPFAAGEARAIARVFSLQPNRVALGSGASERFVKTAPLADVGVVHVAAHARADAVFPDRSAVFLAAGAPEEDGWLQPSEIAELDLRGRLVVLSACDSAEGAFLSGEGPLSLARAFFAAGARGVVATRWPLRDDDAAFMMERFYEAISEGDSVAAALRHARRQAITRGLPAAAWAGFVALGDGGQQPVSPRRVRRGRTLLLAALMVTMVIGVVAWRRSRGEGIGLR